jgi:hypothetical protein
VEWVVSAKRKKFIKEQKESAAALHGVEERVS